ncbi:LabA-like NYN domain-containing protein [Thalassotalea agarivorans]|uniref:Uncharacterized conserved protein, LabA/DUF88 family n=1 Tax=Thalassotalea agarivorans TaxID=349064 RepID=A0A1I0H2L5_THASX|nr:NYN domain-containing protein [Thalassotalea agarivorans]SET76932.1 Uncharacterized conserved protein, LabA/DUF88 family [Thalassotalea agarivorans]
MESITILVDIQNIYYTTRDAYQRRFDYNAFWQQVTEGKQVNKAIAYAIDRGDEKQRQFQNILRGIGFEVKLKPFIQRKDGSAKGDWDVGITVDAIAHGSDSDRVVLLSGDGDFDVLVKHLIQHHNTEVDVYGVESLTAQSLINVSTRFHPIDSNLLL